MLLMFFSLIFSAHAQISTGNEIGTANLDKDKISVSHNFDEHLKIYGTISEPARGTKITILITDPNGDPDPSSQQIFTTDVGYFETFKILNWESIRGTYTVLVSSNNKIIGSLLFVVQESDKYPVNVQTPKQTTHDTVLTLNLEKKTIERTLFFNGVASPSFLDLTCGGYSDSGTGVKDTLKKVIGK